MTDRIYHHARRQGKTLMAAVEQAKKAIQDIRRNGWMKPWSIYINGERVEVVSEEDCKKHREQRGSREVQALSTLWRLPFWLHSLLVPGLCGAKLEGTFHPRSLAKPESYRCRKTKCDPQNDLHSAHYQKPDGSWHSVGW